MKLPICKPSIISYVHHANQLSILETNENARLYVANNYLQIYSRDVGPTDIFDFYTYDGLYPRFPFLSWSWLPSTLLRDFGGQLVDQICIALDSGRYVEATFDEFYLSAKPSYQREHLEHLNLIFGYCKKERIFHVNGFINGAVFSQFVITFDEFEAAMRDDFGFAFISWTDSPVYTNSQAYSAPITKIYLNDFLESRNSFLSYQPERSTFGRATYEVAASLVEKRNGREIDIRVWCVYHEHKLKLNALAEFLINERGAEIPAEIRRELKDLEQDFLQLRNYLLEAKFSNMQVNIRSLRENLERLSAAEAVVMKALISAAN